MTFINSIFNWHDAIEITFFSAVIYYFSRWLIGDKQKNLLFAFYGYCIALITAFHFNFPSIATLLFVGAPIVTVIFIMLHKETLQRNFITLKNIIPAQENTQEHWLESLMRSCLIAMNNNKELLCVIEQKDSLVELLDAPFFIDAPLNKGLLDLLLENSSFEPKKIVWITQSGLLRAINAEWKLAGQELQFSMPGTIPTWKQEASLISSKTDAIIFKASADQRLFDVIVQDKHFEQLNTSTMIKLIKKYQGIVEQNKTGASYVPHSQKGLGQQHRA